MIALVVHAEMPRQRCTPCGNSGAAAAVSASVSSFLFTNNTCGRRGCTAGSSHTKVARDIMARVSLRLTCCVSDRALRFCR